MSRAEQVVPLGELRTAPLIVDALYEGGRAGNSGDDPLNALLQVSLMGGFRYRGTLDRLELVVLTTTRNDPDWPDSLDPETGVFTYYGDNKKPGRPLLQTPRHGNEILDSLFQLAQGGFDERRQMPPILVFSSAGEWRDMLFLGLAVPGTTDMRVSEDLVAIWKISNGRRFQNYRARFTILREQVISRAWINDVLEGASSWERAPNTWKHWCKTGERTPLEGTRVAEHRTKREQLPSDSGGLEIIREIHQWFSMRPHDFEKCAADLAKMMLPNITFLDLTRPSRDGGRDGIGQLRIGEGQASIVIDFALEAKCYSIENSVGVREISRLISRLRHRQFGILVTTSYLEMQAYKEVKEDKHPIIVLAAVDILDLLRSHRRSTLQSVRDWLSVEYPPTEREIANA